MGRIRVRPVTGDNWDAFARLFEARGGPHYCWCTVYRFANAHQMKPAEKKAAMERLVLDATPIGVLAYEDEQPVGWCSIAPRETYLKLQRSRTMPRVTRPDTPTWTVLCFYVARSHRHCGVTRALLRGALAYARAQGAKVVEGYPFDAAGISATHHGHSSVFRALRFRQDGRRWFLRLGPGSGRVA
jgi:GNAT superfamily N-acetyltransferase